MACSRSLLSAHADQLLTGRPKPLGVAVVVASLGGALLPSAAEELSGDEAQVAAGRECDTRGCAGVRAAHERTREGNEKPLGAARVFSSEPSTHYTWVERVGRDRASVKPPCKFVGEENDRELGLVVRASPGVVVFALEVVEVDAPEALRVG